MSPPRYDSNTSDPTKMAQPLKFEFSGKTAKNRFMKAAMTERLSSWNGPKETANRGIPSKGLINVYKRWGEGGFGQILTGNLMIDYNQLEGMGNAIIPRDAEFSGARFDAFRELATAAKAHGSLIIGQVSHPGRQVERKIQPNPFSASAVPMQGKPMGMDFAKPHAASQKEIDNVIECFAHAAEFLEKASFDGIQLHAAHGYLLAQFLSPRTNQRTDKYGGSLENRMRVITEIVNKCRERVSKSFIISIKLNSVEFQDKGFTPAEARSVCAMLEQARLDWVELSGGTYESLGLSHQRESTKKRESFFIEFAEEIVKPLTKTKVYITGGFKSLGAMTDALKIVDGIGLGRPVCQEPRLPQDMLDGKVNSALKLLLDENDYGTTEVAAGSQIRQLSKNEIPIDLSKEENLKSFNLDMAKWEKALEADTEDMVYGYIDLSPSSSLPPSAAPMAKF